MDESRNPTESPPPPSRSLVRLVHRLGSSMVWAVGLAVVFVSGAALTMILLSRRPEAASVALRFVNRALAGATDLRLEADRTLLLEHGAHLVRPRISIVDSTGRAMPFLEAADLTVMTSWGSLLLGRPEQFHVNLRAARILLRRRADGSFVLPHFRGSGKPPSPLARLELDVHFTDLAVLQVVGSAPPETLAATVGGEVQARQRGARWEVTTVGVRGRGPAAGLARAKLDARLRYEAGALDVTRLRLESDGGWIAAQGKGRVSPEVDLAGRLEVGELTWSRLAHWTGQKALDLSGGLAGSIAWSAQGDSVTLEGGRFDVLWRDEPGATTFDGHWADGRLALTKATVRWRTTAFQGRFDLDTRSDRGWAIIGHIRGLDLATLPRLWPMPALDRSDLEGAIRISGKKRRLEGAVADARGRWREFGLTDLDGRWAMVGNVQTIDARAVFGGGKVGAAGTIRPGALDLAVSGSGIDAARLSAATWRSLGITRPPSGRIEVLEGRLVGPPGAPRATGWTLLSGLVVEGATLRAAEVEFDGVLGRPLEGGLTLRGQDARIGVARADTITATISFAGGAILVEGLRAARGDSLLEMSGRVERRGEAWVVAVDRAAWDVGEALALETEGPLHLRIEPGGSVIVERAHILSNAGSVALTGTWGGKSAPSDLLLDLETLDLESMLGPFLPEANARGIVTGRARVEGMGEDRVYTVDLEGRDLRWRRLGARRLVARGRFAQDAWQVEQLDLDTGRGRLRFSGQLAWAEPPVFDADVAAWNRALEASPRWHGELAADSLAMDQIAEWVPSIGGWRGVLDLKCTLDGRPAAPQARLTGAIRRPGWGQATLDDFNVDAEYRDELVTVHRFAMAGPDSLGPSVTGTLPLRLGWGIEPGERLPDRPMSLVAFARGLDLSLLPLVLPQIAAAGGRVDVDARLTGTPRQPQIDGGLSVRGGILRPSSREEVLTEVDGRIVLQGNHLVIERLTARQGKKGRVIVRPGGTGTIENLRIVDYALDTELQSITAFSSGEYVIVFDARLRIEDGLDRGGPLPLPHLTGTARVQEGQFLYNFADPSRQQATQGPLVMPPWTYAIDVDADNNVWYRPTDANIEGRLTDFRVIQDSDRFLMLGEVEALRGTYYFLGNAFKVESGNLFFDAAQEMDPTVDATLTTEKVLPTSGTRETITLTVTGRAMSPTVTLTSTPTALTQGEIVSLLTYGQLTGGARGLATGGAQYLARQLSKEIPELERYFGTIDVSERYSEGREDYASQAFTTVGITRYFTRDLLVRYSQVVGDVSQTDAVDYQDLTAEYRLNRLLFLSGQVTRRRGVLITSQDQTIYNLDVRARHEY